MENKDSERNQTLVQGNSQSAQEVCAVVFEMCNLMFLPVD